MVSFLCFLTVRVTRVSADGPPRCDGTTLEDILLFTERD